MLRLRTRIVTAGINVRARSRDLERNSDIMNAVIGAYKRNVVGGGYQIQVKTDDPDLNKQIEKAWKKWCKKAEL